MYGKIEYDQQGLPKCEICGKHYHRVLAHVRQKHDMNEREYKTMFGFDLIKGICSKESSDKTRITTLENYDKCIAKNLLNGGKRTRFKKGAKGRTKEMVSAQTKQMLIDRLSKPEMIAAMKKSGKKVGESQLGNKARWNKLKKVENENA